MPSRDPYVDAVPSGPVLVWYRTDGRNGLIYDLPAIITVTQATHPGDYPCTWCGRNDVPRGEECPANGTSSCDVRKNPLPVPSSRTHVHLTVLTPGGEGTMLRKEDGEPYSPGDDRDYVGAFEMRPGSGTYVEHDVPFSEAAEPRSWRWAL